MDSSYPNPITPGQTAEFDVTVNSVFGFSSPIQYSASNVTELPAGASVSFNFSTVTPPANGSAQNIIAINTASNSPVGVYSPRVKGVSGSLARNGSLSLTILSSLPDFQISATPSSQTVGPTGSTTYTVQVTSVSGFAGTVSLSVVSGLPAGAAAAFSPATISGGNGTSTLTINTSGSPAGTTTLVIYGVSGSLSHSASAYLVVSTPQQIVTSVPTNLSLIVDGAPCTSPCTFPAWIQGSSHTLNTTSPQSIGGTTYVFSSWSDGLAQLHSVTVGSSSPTYVATFTTQGGNYTISGMVTQGGTPLTNITVSVTGQTPQTTGLNGTYSFSVASGGNYTVTPSSSSYTFCPGTAVFNNLTGNETANFATSGAGPAREYIHLGTRVIAIENCGGP